jgi:hypothetical protein
MARDAHDSPYRRAMPHEAAVAELVASAGGQLDPQVIETLLDLVGREARIPEPEVEHAERPPFESRGQAVAGVAAQRLQADGVPFATLPA